MKKLVILLSIIAISFVTTNTYAANMTVGLGPIGNIYVVDASPELDPGVGGHVFFDYRWSPQMSTTLSIMVTTQDGTGISDRDNGIEFLGMPILDLKYYVISTQSRWDPYIQGGVGMYAISEGTTDNGTTAVGFGANFGIGTDYYLNEKFSCGVSAIFRSIGLIDSTSGDQNGKAVFPLSMLGNIAYHF